MKSTPVSKNERIASIDIIRGFALLGIFLVNMPSFHSPDFLIQLYGIEQDHQGIHFWMGLLFLIFIDHKFYTIFSLLFGLGFYMFMNRAEENGSPKTRLFLRRMLALLGMGSVHLVLLWFGDILHLYAITGIFLLFFYKRNNKTLIIWAFSLMIVAHALMSIQFLIPEDMLEEINIMSMQNYLEVKSDYMEIYQQGNYWGWVSYRYSTEIIPIMQNIPFTMMTVLAMFLLGMYAGRQGVFNQTPLHLSFIKKTQRMTLLLSIPIIFFMLFIHFNIYEIGPYRGGTIQLLASLSGMSLSLYYISSFILLLRNKHWLRRLRALGYVGQMALTNYFMQTVISLSLVHGFGMYGKVSLGIGTLLVLLIYIVQVLISYYWLQRFTYGPLEWFWRSITYGYFQGMKKKREKDAKTTY